MVQFNREQAEKYRRIMNQAAVSLPDDEAAYAPMMFERWAPGVEYKVGFRVCHNDRLYKTLQTHISHDGWEPDKAVSLFAEVLIPDPSVIPEWVQPGSTNAYMKGDKVKHNGKVWVSDVDNNIWEPGVFGWREA